MTKPTIRYEPLEGEPPFLPRRPLPLSLALGTARLLGTGLLALLRLAVTSILALAIAALLLVVGLHVASSRVPALADANDYLSGVLHASADWMGSEPQLQDTTDYFSEASSTAVARATPSPGSTANLVAMLSQLAPSTLRDVYQQAVPTLQSYDAFLGDVQSALENNNDLDAFFTQVQPWLQEAENESQNTAGGEETPSP